ncbi:hypothetical protein [Mariniblastus fucicola]|nr:hypothetical protein [Mariniblastus fucicola]
MQCLFAEGDPEAVRKLAQEFQDRNANFADDYKERASDALRDSG